MQMLQAHWLSCQPINVQCHGVVNKIELFSCFSELWKHIFKQMANQIPEKT